MERYWGGAAERNYSDSEMLFFIPLAKFSLSCAIPRAVAHPTEKIKSKRARMEIILFFMAWFHAGLQGPAHSATWKRIPPSRDGSPHVESFPSSVDFLLLHPS